MVLSKKESEIVADISKRYGKVLDLNKSPAVLIEILRNFGHVLDPSGSGGAGGVSPSTIAGSGPPPTPPPTSDEGEAVRIADVMKAVLKLQGDINAIARAVGKMAK